MEIPTLLSTFGIHVTTIIVYSAIAETQMPEFVRSPLTDGRINAVAFYSPRSADITCELITKAGLIESTKHIHAFCLSLSVAAAANRLPWAGVHACAAPTRHAMRELVVSHMRDLL